LGFKRILVHGTVQPTSIGLRSSHGCIRMFNKDITDLYSKVPVGTNVRIIYEP
jgi:L,D-transpeptidase ErfK/SrfK